VIDLIIYAIPAGWRERLGYLFRGPGWSPDGRGGGTRG
jgi:hypothetical protein